MVSADRGDFAAGHGVGLVVRTATGTADETALALQEIATGLAIGADGPPQFVTLHYGSSRNPSELWQHARHWFADQALHGASSCLGVMTEKGVSQGSGNAIGAFAIWDKEGDYASAMVPLDGLEPRAAGAEATRAALARAGRLGEAPDLVWLSASPGHEEAILEGIKDVIGRPALILGGSAADNDVSGRWSVMASDGTSPEAVVVSVLFPSAPFGCAFESGYAPTARRGTVTAAAGRKLLTIDDRPAMDIYAEWTDGRIAAPPRGNRSILSEATLSPLGRKQSEIGGIPQYLLAHPAIAHADGSMELFANVEAGEAICLMEGSDISLVQRAGRIALNSRDQLGTAPLAGALMVYCGGCMLAIRDRMDEVVASVAESLGGAPFLGVFSFGEQGETLDGDSAHGNLMISCTSFARSRTLNLRDEP